MSTRNHRSKESTANTTRRFIFGPALALAFALTMMTCSLPLPAAENDGPQGQRIFKVASVQMRSSRDLEANTRTTISLLKQCAGKGAEAAVFPECSLTGYYPDLVCASSGEQIEKAIQAVAGACEEYKIAAIFGSPTWEQKKLLNSAIIINSKGIVIERYHKVQLAENWPVGGDHLSVFYLNGVPCSVIVCHDERYPELVRLPVLAGARVVFYLSHESGVKLESKIEPYRAQIQARAVENSVFVVHANAPANADTTGSHGQSRLIAPDGNILKEASVFQEGILAGDLDLSQATARNALGSLKRGPLAQWYEEGVRQVRIIRE